MIYKEQRELKRLRELACALYAGSGALNMSEAWMDVLLAACDGRPFKLTKKLFPIAPEPSDE